MESNKERFDKARLLKGYIGNIRAAYTRDFTSEDDVKKQKAVATYMIDKLALNAGTEKCGFEGGKKMTIDLVLRSSCSGCGSSSDLYGSNCKHKTLCISCGKSMAEKKAKCSDCGATLTRLIREYSVLANAVDDKDYFIGRFSTGVPKFLEKKKKKKKNCENKWSLYKKKSKDGLQGRQVSFQDTLLGNKPWVLEDETGQYQYQGQPEEQSAAYYILMREGKEISAIPAGSWFNFNKVAQYKQFTLEEAEEKMNSRKKAQHGYERWMMKAATNGAVAFSEGEKFGSKDSKTTTGDSDDDDEGNFSDKGDEDEEEEGARKNRRRAKKRGGDDEGASGDDDLDDEADDSVKGDDWEHEEIFSDDDENNPEEIEDFATEVPAPPKLKKDDDEDDNNEEEGGLSKSGKELKKLLGRLDESDTEDDDDNDNEDMDEDIEDSPLKPVASGSAQTTPSTTKGKRKSNYYDTKAPTSTPSQKVKTENDQKPSIKVEHASAGLVTEEEIKAVLMQQSPITMRDLVSTFSGRLGLQEEKAAFSAMLQRMLYQKTISKIPKDDGTGYMLKLA